MYADVQDFLGQDLPKYDQEMIWTALVGRLGDEFGYALLLYKKANKDRKIQRRFEYEIYSSQRNPRRKKFGFTI